MKKFLISIICILNSGICFAEKIEIFRSNDVDEVEINSVFGSIRVEEVQGSEVVLEYQKKMFTKEICKLEVFMDGDDLVANVERNDERREFDCEVDFLLKVPADRELLLLLSKGNIDVEGDFEELEVKIVDGKASFKGSMDEVDFNMVNGEVSFQGVYNEIDVNMVNGSIDFKAAVTEMMVYMVNGDNRFQYTELKKESDIKIRAVNGINKFLLPEDTIVDVGHWILGGNVTSNVKEEGNANLYIDGFSIAGLMSVKYNEMEKL